MKSVEGLLSHLDTLDIKVWVEANRLRVNAPKGALTLALRTELAERKAEIIAFLRQADPASHPKRYVIRPMPQRKNLSLSFAQERLWFLEQLEPGSPVYNIPAVLRLTGALDVQALEQSLNEIVRRHESLRTTFSVVEGEPVQVVVPALTLALPVVALEEFLPDEREAQAMQLATEEAQRPFDLAQGPLLQAALLRLDRENHILLLTMHHIVSDGWSRTVFFRELSTLYEAFYTGEPSPLPDLPIQYADFAVWQREWLPGEVLETQLSYWRQQLAGSPSVLNLPTDRPRPAVQSYRGARQSVMLPSALSESLRALSSQEGATLFTTLLAAFKVLLHRYTGEKDILVGTPIANRNRLEIENLIGFFVNTLVLRSDLSANPTFRELLSQAREICLEAYAHQDLPFEKLVRELQPERNLSHAPLFQVMFALQNVPRQTLELPGLTVNRLEVDSGTAKFDLALSIVEEAEGLRAVCEYNTDLFDATTIERMMGHYQTLLEGIVANPDQRVSLLPLLTEAERHQMLVEWNDTQVDYPEELCIHQLFEAQVERTPDAVAVVFEDQQLTYRELNTRANQLAHYLKERGVGPEVLVGICVERSLEMVVGLLGILKGGGAYVPLDPTYPEERLAYMLEDAQVSVLLTQEWLPKRFPHRTVEVVYLNTGWEAISQESTGNPICKVTTDSLAYVMYTSGSTGQPKGVMIEHKSLINYLYWVNENLLDDTSQSLPMVTRLAFDASLKQLFAPLLSGGEVWGLPDGIITQPAKLLRVLDTRSQVGLNCVPSLWKVMLDAIESNPAIISPKNLTHLFVGGESISRELVHKSFTTLPLLQIWNLYGPTETTANATVAKLLPGEDVNIGQPIANTQVYILDRYLQPVPVGVTGELYIGGAGLARGYHNRPELTAEKFILSPFSSGPNVRLYKTGDLACYLPDGNIEFLGRIDHQVKIRGFRIELGEIETVLGQHPSVREAIVLAREDDPADQRLVAYIVSGQEQAPTNSELSSFLKQKLPEYMVPSAFVMLDMLPLTPNGKVDRQALPAPAQTSPELEEDFVPPHTFLETTIAQVWQEMLGLDRVSVYDNFFDLGGHSLLAMRVIARLEKELGLRFHPRDLIFQTLGQLASAGEERIQTNQQPRSTSFAQRVSDVIKEAIGQKHA
jgi:amino acid adenylation domain-containing protein